MKRGIYGLAFTVAVVAAFAFKADTKSTRSVSLANQAVFHKLDACQEPVVCSNNPSRPACLLDPQSNPVPMYDDQFVCEDLSSFQFQPE